MAWIVLGTSLLLLGGVLCWLLYELMLPTSDKETVQTNINRPDESSSRSGVPAPQSTYHPTIIYTPTPLPPTPAPPLATNPLESGGRINITGGWLKKEGEATRIHFNRGAISISFSDQLLGEYCIYYLRAGAGQTMTIAPTITLGRFYNLTVIDRQAGTTVYQSGNKVFSCTLPSTGDYQITVYGEPRTTYELQISVVY